MFSLGGLEILVLVIVIVIFIGPKQLPDLLKQIGNFSKSIKKISRDFKSSLNAIANDNELKKVKDSIDGIKDVKNIIDPKDSFDAIKDVKNIIDPKNTIQNEIDSAKESVNIFEKEISDLDKSKNKKK